VLEIQTNLAPAALLERIKALEVELGRTPTFRYGPRHIDIDILLYDELVLSLPALELPHPRLAERAFVLAPLADIVPDLPLPPGGQTVKNLLAKLDCSGVKLYTPNLSTPMEERKMTQAQAKPIIDSPGPQAGFSAARRPDGGMHIQFFSITHATLERWRAFSLAHLENSDRLTTNLYDLRQIEALPEEAVRYALEVNSDPSVRNIRLAVVVASEKVRQALQQIDALSAGYGVEMGIFTDIGEAEAWLDRPLTLVV
jgi:hypothetical protein